MMMETIPPHEDILAWLEEKMNAGDYLLAHAIDGVIWGRKTNDWLFLSSDVDANVSPLLTASTLQQARIFNKDRELFVCYEADSWKYREIIDVQDLKDGIHYFDETHILWGTKGEAENGFTLLADGSQGLRHVVPIDASRITEKNIRSVLTVRHYFAEDDLGVNYIASSRLVDVEVKEL